MTATQQKKKNIFKKEIRKKINRNSEINIPVLAVCFLTAVSSAKATFGDFSLAILTLVMTAAVDDVLEKAVYSAGGVFAFVLLSAKNPRFIPYLLGQVMYIAVYSVFSKEKYTTAVSLSVIALSRILLSSKGISGDIIYILLEAASVPVLSYSVKYAKELYSGKTFLTGFTDSFYILLYGLIITFSLSGFDSRLMYVGAGTAMAISWRWMTGQRPLYSLSRLLCFFVAVWDKQGFEYLFICGCIIWLTGAFFSEKTSFWGYVPVVFVAFACNLVFLTELMGFALTGTVLAALILYTILPYINRLPKPALQQNFTREKDYRQLQLSMKKLEESLNFLGSCAIDISKLNDKRTNVQQLEDTVAREVCRKCRNNTYCWQEKYSFTANQFSKYSRGMNFSRKNDFDPGFYALCVDVDGVKKSFEENSRLELSRRYIVQSQKNNGKLLQNSFMAISAAVGELLRRSSTGRLVSSAFTMALDKLLWEMDINHSYCLCSQNPDKASFSVPRRTEEKQLYRIKNKLEDMYGVRFSQRQAERVNGEIVYTFCCRPRLGYVRRTESRPMGNVSGDNYLIMTVENKLFVLLSDGMGTGPARAAESRTVLAMSKSLLSRGISVPGMINIVNLALNLRSNGENGASAEVLEVDLLTGCSKLYKAGAGVTLVFDKNTLDRYYRDSLPLGILKDVKYSVEEFMLSTGSTVVMMSDGVGNVSGNIRNLYDKSAEDVARFAISESKIPDDKLAVVIRMCEC